MFISNRGRFAGIAIDPSGREARPPGLELFNVTANDIHLPAEAFGQGIIPRHWHAELELFLLLDGEVYVEAGSRRLSLRPGEGCFINSGVLHAFGPQHGQPYSYHSLLFAADVVAGLPGSAFDLHYVKPVLEDCPEIVPFGPSQASGAYAQLFDQAFAACRDEPPGFELEARYALSRLLLLVRRTSGDLASPHEQIVREARVKQMLRWINEHLDEPISVDDIARAANVGKRECFRLFRQYLHCGPNEYVRQRRILWAAERLSATNDPIATIALDCGFSTPSYFTKCFHRQMGRTPFEWRAQVRAAQYD